MPKKGEISTKAKQVALLNAIGRHHWNVAAACREVGVTPQTHHVWLKNYPEYKEQFETIPELELDFVEGKLFELINGVTLAKVDATGEVKVYDQPPCKTSIIFYLKTKGKKRGYIEGQQAIVQQEGEKATITLPNGTIITI